MFKNLNYSQKVFVPHKKSKTRFHKKNFTKKVHKKSNNFQKNSNLRTGIFIECVIYRTSILPKIRKKFKNFDQIFLISTSDKFSIQYF